MQKISVFLAKIVPLLNAVVRCCVRDFYRLLQIFTDFYRKFYRLCLRNPASALLQSDRNLKKWQWCHNFPTWRYHQFFCAVALFLLSSLVTGPSFKSMSSLVLELWHLEKSWNQKLLRLSFAQYLETGTSCQHQIWHERL